jgi:hypothetical protein
MSPKSWRWSQISNATTAFDFLAELAARLAVSRGGQFDSPIIIVNFVGCRKHLLAFQRLCEP